MAEPETTRHRSGFTEINEKTDLGIRLIAVGQAKYPESVVTGV